MCHPCLGQLLCRATVGGSHTDIVAQGYDINDATPPLSHAEEESVARREARLQVRRAANPSVCDDGLVGVRRVVAALPSAEA